MADITSAVQEIRSQMRMPPSDMDVKLIKKLIDDVQPRISASDSLHIELRKYKMRLAAISAQRDIEPPQKIHAQGQIHPRSQSNSLFGDISSLQVQGNRLQNSLKTSLDSEEMGIITLQNLRQQRSQMSEAQKQLEQANAHIDKSSGFIQKMKTRQRQMLMVKFGACSFVIIVVLVIVICFSLNVFRK